MTEVLYPKADPRRIRRLARKLRAAVLVPAALLATGAAAQQQQQQTCDRACLEQFVIRYLDAVAADDPSKVPISRDVRFTENGQQLLIGDGLWNSMKAKGKYRLFVADPAAGQIGFFGTIQEDASDPDKFSGSLIALRLLVKNRQIVEIEQIVIRDRNDPIENSYELVDNLPLHPKLTATVPLAERMSRADLVTQANKYFTGIQKNDGHGDYPFTPDCLRHENGHQATLAPTPAGETRPDPKVTSNYSNQWTCTEQFESGLMGFVSRIRDRRFVAVDEERGLVFSFAFFDHPAGETRHFKAADGRELVVGPVQPWTWELGEIFKIEKGKISKIDAFLHRSPYGMNSGWSTWAQGMSDVARDVTFEAPTGF